MASSTSDLIVRLSLDTTNFESAMSKFEGQTTKLQASCTNASTGITNFKQVTAQLQTSAQTLTDKLAAQKQKVADLEAAYEKSKAETGENSEETKKLAAQLEQAKQKVSQTEQALKLATRQLKLSQNGFYQLGTRLENIGAKLESVGKKVSQVGQQLTTKVTTPIVALGTVCVKTFTSFDDSLKTVQATMGLVAGSSEEADRQIALLNSTAQEMGRATRYSASEAASALNYLALAGYDADEACAALPQVLALAQAGGLDLAYASDLATDAMAALGLSMDQLSNFSDQMAVTAQKSNTSVGQLSEAILTVGGTAKNLKGSTAELNAELGILANRGIKGAEGGTHLRNVILSLTNPTDKAAAQLEKLGVSVFDSSGNMRSMNDIMMDLNRSMDGMTAEQKQNIISTIFNKTDLAAVTALLDGCGDEFYELIGYIDESEGAARQMADTMESGLGGTFRTLKSVVEGLAISFGEKLAPYIQKAVEKITSIVNWLTSLDDKTKDTTTNYYDRMQYKASVTAAGAIAAGRLGVFNSAGKLILLSTAAFDVTKPILYIGTAYATGKLTQTDNYISWGTAFSLADTVSGFSGTAGATVYIRGTLNGNLFTPASGVPTTTAPITEDGYTYILLGLMSTTTAAVLAPEHPMFRYYNGGFKTISQISYEAFLTSEEAQEAIDALAVGGRNYIFNSGSEVATSTAQIARYALSEPMIAGEQYTVSLTLTPMEEYAVLTMRTSEGATILAIIDLQEVTRQTVHATFIAEYAQGKSSDDAPDNADILIYRKPASAGTATTIIHQIKLEKGNRATDWTAAPEDAEEALEQKLSSVRAQISTGADSIRQEVQATYALASDMTQVTQPVGTLSEQTQSNYTWAVTRINQLQQDLADAHEATEDELAILRTYMSFDEQGLVIGKTGNPFTFRVVNDRLAFYMNDSEVAYLSNNKLYVTHAEILSRLIIGKFAFEPQSNGNLSLIYNG